MTHKQVTLVQAIACTAGTILFVKVLKVVGVVQDETSFIAGFALYLAWLARIRQDE